MLTSLLPDLRHALRALLKAPGFSLAVLLTLALGLGANASVFSLLEQALWRPLPFKDPEALVVVHEINQEQPWNVGQLSAPNFLDFERETRSFTGMAGFMNRSLNLSGEGTPEVLRAGRVSANFFDVLGVQPTLGRAFRRDEGEAGASHVVLLSHELWQRRFGADPSLVGRTLRLDGEGWQVVGVLPRGFRFPYRLFQADLYFPIAFDAGEKGPEGRGNHYFSGVARLKPGVPKEAAAQDMARVMAGLAKIYPDACFGYSAGVQPLQAAVLGPKRPGQLKLLMGVAALVLLIACVNVANLLLARGLARRQELAIRASLGADRAHLLRQLMIESLLLAVGGGLLGLFASSWITAGLLRVVSLPVGISAELSLRTLLAMGGLTLLTSLLFGALPAWQATRGDLTPALREGAKGSATAGTHRLRGALVVGEVALATALLVTTGLMLKGLWRLQSRPLGFEPAQVLTGSLFPPEASQTDSERNHAYARALVQRLAASPGVAAAALTDTLPMGGSSNDSGYSVEGEAPLPPGRFQSIFVHLVTPGFFETLRMPLQLGRDFTWTEANGTCIVSDTFAKRHFAGHSPLGRHLRIGDAPWMEIVGVVPAAEQDGPGAVPLPHVYFPFRGQPTPLLQAAVRTVSAPLGLRSLLPAAALDLNPDLPMTRIVTLDDLVARSLDAERTQGLLMAAFAAVALVLALVGIYGLMSFVARGRRRELGIRAALGATLLDLLRLMVGQGSRLVAAGLGLGLLAAAFATRSLAAQLEGVSGLDPLTYAAVTAVLGFTALLACLVPALRAARVDPAVALRTE